MVSSAHATGTRSMVITNAATMREPPRSIPSGSRERRLLVELPFGVRACPIDIMKKDLRGRLAVETVAPMRALDAAVQQRIAWVQLDARDAERSLNTDRPRSVCDEPQAKGQADLAGRPIRVLLH